MKAAITPAVNGKWEVRDIPRPRPGPNEVLMRITASGLCFTDVHITHGMIPTQFPRTLGHEPVGEIVEVGPGVTKRKIGDRVGVVRIDGHGHLGVQFSKAAGHHTIAVTHSKDKEKMLRQLGADDVVSDGDALMKSGGADVILVTGNSWKAAADAMKGLRPQGRVVLMGVGGDGLQVPIDLLFKEGKILGSSQNDPEHLYEALDFVAKGKVKVITEIYPLADIAKAYDRVEKGEVRFRAVIKP